MKSNLLSSFYNNWIGVYGDIQVVEVSFGDIWITDLNVDGESHGKAAKGNKKGLHDAIIKDCVLVDYCEGRVSKC